MATSQLDCVLHHVRKLIGMRKEADLTDGDLLDRFVNRQDEAAFESLVRRHGPMVLRVCRRVLGEMHAAEDAFQATFLVLSRKAASIRQRASLGGWLYEVAYHLAVRNKADAARRCRHERASAMPTTVTGAEEDQANVQAVLDEELRRLPEKYRTPLVLCYLEGKSNLQAARELGWPAGSMSSRLQRAREMLRDRLAGRGVALSAAGLVSLLGENAAEAAVPAALVQTTVHAAVLYAAGQTSVAGLASAQAVVLAEGMLNTMITYKLKMVAALLLAVTILGTGTSVLVQRGAVAQAAAADDPRVAAADKADSSQPADAKKGDVYGDPLPEGALARMGTLRFRHGGPVTFLGYIDDGKKIVTACSDGFFRVWEASTGKLVRRFGKGGPGGDPNVAWGIATSAMVYGGGGGANVALSPDGKLLAAATNNGGAQLWDIETGKDIRAITPTPAQAGIGGRGFVAGLSLVFSPDSKTLATKGGDQLIRLWEVETAKEIRQIGKKPDATKAIRVYGGASGTLAFSADGKAIASIGLEFENNRGTPIARFYEVESGNELRSIKAPPNNFNIGNGILSRDGKIVAFGNTDGTIKLHDAETGKETRTLGQAQQNVFFSALVFAPDGKTLATRSNNSAAIQLWDVENGKELRAMGEAAPAANANGGLVRFVGGGNSQTIAFTPDGKTLAEGLPSNSIRLWDVATAKEVPPVNGHQGGVNSTSVSPDGKTLTTIGADNSVRRWELATGKQLSEFKLPAGTANAVLSADGKTIAVGAANNSLQIIDVATGKETKKIDMPAGQNPFGQVLGGSGGIALSPDGKVVAARGFDQTVRCFDTGTGKEMTPLAEANPNDPANGVFFAVAGGMGVGGRPTMVFSPDGKVLATVNAGNAAMKGVIINGAAPAAQTPSIRLWNVSLGKPMARVETPKGVAALAFSPDGRYIATANADNSGLSLWEVITGKECLHIKAKGDQPAQAQPAPPAPGAAVMIGRVQGNVASVSVAISPDGRTLASGGADRTIRLWDMATGKELGQFTGHEGGVLDVTFAPDSRTVISGSADTTAMVWDGARFIQKERATVQLESQQVEDLWKDLMADPEKAYKAIGTLSTAPKQAVALIGERVKPAAGVEQQRIDQLVKDLDSEKFETRQKATQELERFGELAQPALQKVLDSQPGLETRQRVEKLLEQLVSGQAPPPEILRTIRSVKVLAQVATPEAKEVLGTLAKGAAGDKLTREAESALKRLAK